MFDSDWFGLQSVRRSRTKKKGNLSFDDDFKFISGGGLGDSNEDPWNLDAAIRFAKHKQESVSWWSNLENHMNSRCFHNPQFVVLKWTRAVLSCLGLCCINDVWNIAFRQLSRSFCGRLSCFLSYIICCNYNLFLSKFVVRQRASAVLSCSRLCCINIILKKIWRFVCCRGHFVDDWIVFRPILSFCNCNLFWSELKSEYIWRVKFRPRELYEVRVVHSKTCLHERCSFNFVFLSISLATENALIEILKKIIYNVCKNILARVWCSLFVLSSLVEGL